MNHSVHFGNLQLGGWRQLGKPRGAMAPNAELARNSSSDLFLVKDCVRSTGKAFKHMEAPSCLQDARQAVSPVTLWAECFQVLGLLFKNKIKSIQMTR